MAGRYVLENAAAAACTVLVCKAAKAVHGYAAGNSGVCGLEELGDSLVFADSVRYIGSINVAGGSVM